MVLLKDLLNEGGVEYNEKLFDSDMGIAGLGSDLFVSTY